MGTRSNRGQEALNKEFEDAEIEAIRKRTEKALLEATTGQEKILALQKQYQSESILLDEEKERKIAEAKKKSAGLESAEDKAKLDNFNHFYELKLLILYLELNKFSFLISLPLES